MSAMYCEPIYLWRFLCLCGGTLTHSEGPDWSYQACSCGFFSWETYEPEPEPEYDFDGCPVCVS